ncbi:MAG: site-2 protease family protein [Arthrospira sp. SH-MAG29]|nr:site-2 protease family protein [Arthrospira sp. SH-MAG29]MBS0015371.1 site-2 protease family protein [Arthrospira sp. SH-MAG29]
MNGSIRVGNLFGIPFFINSSWFIVLGLMTLSYGGSLAVQFPQLGMGLPWLLGLVAALLLFASVVAHELGHSFVAIQQGIEVKSITLFLFGGLASLDKEAKTPGNAFWIAIAGPAVSLALCGVFVAIALSSVVGGPVGAIVNLLAYINLALALFNLIPGLPLDGGNVLKSIVWKITGNQYKGIVFASRVGQGFGWLAIIYGLLPVLISGSFPNFWTVLIGWFLLQNAGALAQDARLRDRLSEYTAADALIPNHSVVSANLSLRELANEYIIGKPQARRFLVTDDNGQLIGQIQVDDLKLVPTSQWPLVSVQELIQPVDLKITVEAERSLLDVVALLEEQKIDELPVFRNGVLVGLIQKASIRNLLEQKILTRPA